MYSKLPPGYITRSTCIILSTGLAAYGGIEILFGGETFYRKALMPAVHSYTDGEDAHKQAVKMAKWGLIPRFGPNHWEYPELECTLFGKKLRNPVGLAAGFDKDGDAIVPLGKSGFGMVEIGSVTPLPQPGNDRPRVFRLLEDEGVINRYGFNSLGAGAVQRKVKTARENWSERSALFGVNLGKNKMSDDAKIDYEIGVNYLGPYADYIVINVSSPNTPGLRSMQNKKELQNLLKTVKHAVDILNVEERPALVLKIAPDLVESEMKDIAAVVLDKTYGVDGLIVSNTTVARASSLKSEHAKEGGGLSGVPLREMSTQCVREMYKLTGGRVPIIGVGGISSGEDAYEKIRAGASAVQVYSALVFHGWPIIGKVKRELAECLRRDGFTSVSQAVGADHKKK
ncbi:hypothetical protein PMAYCL1PPCAC_24183 [Pristionchus mayeri]|uniref:Dihydroorotate dehydrogenase (quinone), mitochondrial n=1 Tax=Pristionchus mayeri TaxID=1317129 RepID=A0AAN5CZP4_9BILA|nr:hypothetical protein PMAYCL1PPCAC_24183 [Pristionchus mayeri]